LLDILLAKISIVLTLLSSLFIGTPELAVPPNSWSDPFLKEIRFELPSPPLIEDFEAHIAPVGPELPSNVVLPITEGYPTPDACSCIRTARNEGLNIPLANAEDQVPNGPPVLGGGILFYYPKTDTSHLAVITDFTEYGYLVTEGNFKECEVTERVVEYNDRFITGFINA